MKLLKSYLTILFIILISSCSNKDNKPSPSNYTVDLVKSELEAFSKHLPIEGGLGMLITDVDFDDATYTIKYRYQYTVPGVHKPSDSQIKEAKNITVNITKSLPKEKKLLQQGFTFRYDYYSLDNEYLFTQEITKEDLEEN